MLMRKHQNGLRADLHVQLGIWVRVSLPRAGKLVTLRFFLQYLFRHGSSQDICDNCKQMNSSLLPLSVQICTLSCDAIVSMSMLTKTTRQK